MFTLCVSYEVECGCINDKFYYNDYNVACSALKKLRDAYLEKNPLDCEEDGESREIDIDKEDCFKMHDNYNIEEVFFAVERIDDFVRHDDDISDVIEQILDYYY